MSSAPVVVVQHAFQSVPSDSWLHKCAREAAHITGHTFVLFNDTTLQLVDVDERNEWDLVEMHNDMFRRPFEEPPLDSEAFPMPLASHEQIRVFTVASDRGTAGGGGTTAVRIELNHPNHRSKQWLHFEVTSGTPDRCRLVAHEGIVPLIIVRNPSL
jgi:hypothetical protein